MRAHTDVQPVWSDDVALLLELQVRRHPQRDAGLGWGAERPVGTLDWPSSDSNATEKRGGTEMKAVFSMEMSGMISTSCWDAMSSSSGGVTEVRRDWGKDIFEVDPVEADSVKADATGVVGVLARGSCDQTRVLKFEIRRHACACSISLFSPFSKAV